MVSTVRSRPNHYVRLGVERTASDEEIARAFAYQMSLFRPMAEAAQIGVAYEVLRDPAKRKAYDETLGFRREAKPSHAPTAISFKISARLIGAGPAERGEPPEPVPSAAPPEPRPFIASPAPAAADAEERRVASAIRAQLAAPPAPPAEPAPVLPAAVSDFYSAHRGYGSSEADDRPLGLNRAVLAGGGIVLAAALVGAWAGAAAGDGEAQPAERAASAPALATPVAGPDSRSAEPGIEGWTERAPSASARRVKRRAATGARRGASEDRLAEIGQSLDPGGYVSLTGDSVHGAGAADAVPVQSTTTR